MNANGSDKQMFTDGSGAQWSPDGTKVAFLKSDDNDITQIYVKFLSSNNESKITNLDESVRTFCLVS